MLFHRADENHAVYLFKVLRTLVFCYDMFGAVGSNMKMAQIFMPHLWILHDVIVVWPGSCNLLQDGQTRAIVVPKSVAIWCVQMLRSFGRGWQMLGEKCCEYVGLKCCNRLTEAL